MSCEEVREECGYQTVQEVDLVPVETCSLHYREDQLCTAATELRLSQCGLVVTSVCRRPSSSPSPSAGQRRRRKKKRRRLKKPDRRSEP